MRMYAIKKDGKALCVCKANTKEQALNIYARRKREEVEPELMGAAEVFDLCVKEGLSVYEPEVTAEGTADGAPAQV